MGLRECGGGLKFSSQVPGNQFLDSVEGMVGYAGQHLAQPFNGQSARISEDLTKYPGASAISWKLRDRAVPIVSCHLSNGDGAGLIRPAVSDAHGLSRGLSG